MTPSANICHRYLELTPGSCFFVVYHENFKPVWIVIQICQIIIILLSLSYESLLTLIYDFIISIVLCTIVELISSQKSVLRDICIKFGSNIPVIFVYIGVIKWVKAKVVFWNVFTLESQIKRLTFRIQVLYAGSGAKFKRITALFGRFEDSVCIAASIWICFLSNFVPSVPVRIDHKITIVPIATTPTTPRGLTLSTIV